MTPTLTATPQITKEPVAELRETAESYVITYKEEDAANTYASKVSLKRRLANNQNVTYEFKKGDQLSYAWSFEVANYNKGTRLTKVNLGLEVETSKMSGFEGGVTIAFEQTGKLPMEAKVKINVKDYFPSNDKVYLYRYEENNKLLCVPNSTYKVDEEGYVTLNIIQGDRYVLLTNAAKSTEKVSVLKQVQVDKKLTLKAGKKKSIQLELPDALNQVEAMDQFNSTINHATYGAVVTYKTSDSSIAKVNASGKITAIKKGTITITTTIQLSNGTAKSYKTKITVK